MPHDALLRAVLGRPAVALAWLRHVLRDHPIADDVDWDGLRIDTTTTIDGRLRRHEADSVCTAGSRSGAFRYLFLTEFAYGQKAAAWKQLFRYTMQSLDLHHRAHPYEPLPVAVPVLLHAGRRQWTGLRALPAPRTPFPVGPDNAGAAFAMAVVDLAASTIEELLALPLPPDLRLAFAMLQTVPGRAADEVLLRLQELAPLLRAVAAPPGEPSDLAVFHSYVLETTDVAPDRLDSCIADLLAPLGEPIVLTTAQRLRDEGRVEGRVEARCETLRLMLQQRFPAEAAACEPRLLAADDAQLLRWTLRVLTARTAADVFADD